MENELDVNIFLSTEFSEQAKKDLSLVSMGLGWFNTIISTDTSNDKKPTYRSYIKSNNLIINPSTFKGLTSRIMLKFQFIKQQQTFLESVWTLMGRMKPIYLVFVDSDETMDIRITNYSNSSDILEDHLNTIMFEFRNEVDITDI